MKRGEPMAQEELSISPRDYLLASSKGESFVYEELQSADDGPFGGEEYSGLEYLDLNAPEYGSIRELSGLKDLFLKSGLTFEGNLLRLTFEDRDERFNPSEGASTWSNMLILPTPRDPKGPFTVSVYQDFTHVGWLTGPDSEEFAIHLVENFDFGCAIVPSRSIEEDRGELVFHYFLKEVMPVTICRLPNRILSTERVAPSKLDWDYEPEIIDLPRNVSWDGIGLVEATLENDSLVSFDGDHDIVHAYYEEILLMADIWTPESTDVFVYVGDKHVGRIRNPEEAAKFHKELASYEPKLGRANRGYFYRSPGEPDGFVFDADVRSIIRIDWGQVEV
jgi:hypothetical protein